MASWPGTLPSPFAGSLSEESPNNIIRSQMDKGPEKLRRRTTAAIRPLSFNMRCTSAQLDDLITFYETTTFSGVDEFTYTHPRTGATESARFVEAPTWQDIQGGIMYDVSIKLEIMP